MESSPGDENCEVVVAPKKSKYSKNSQSKMFRSDHNMVLGRRNLEIHGRGPRHVYQLPKPFVLIYQETNSDALDDLPTNVLVLFEHAKKKKVDIHDEGLASALGNILDLMLNDQKAEQAASVFHFMEGNEALADILIHAFYNEEDDIFEDHEIKTISAQETQAISRILQTMYQCTQMASIGISHLCEKPHLLHLLFSLLVEEENKLFTDATLLLEEMIMSEPRQSAMDLRKIACLPAILNRELTHQQEAHLFHVITTIVSVGDSLHVLDGTLQEHDSWMLKNPRSQLGKEHQEFLIGFEGFLAKLFNLTCQAFKYERPTLRSDPLRLFRGQVDLAPEQVERIYSWILENTEDSTDSPLYQAKLFHEMSIRSDAFLLLSLLLTGKFREKMERCILEYDVVQRLEGTVKTVVWKNLDNVSFNDHRHGDHVDCSPETTVKIQYLRLIYSISDHHLHRYLLLSEEELKEIEKISVSFNVPLDKNFRNLDRTKCCKGNPGLLTNVIERMNSESESSHIRFWMTRALESFLRGSTCSVDQIFLINRNLVEALLDVLLCAEKCSSDVIQGNFDLLASLMKDSMHAFRRFSIAVDSLNTFRYLCRIIDNNLVDSNMFVRCAVLTVHCFDSMTAEYKEFISSSRILNHYANFQKRVQVIVSLISLLTVETLSQENVSCLNTSIVILLIARVNDQLPKYLSAIGNYEIEFRKSGRVILENLNQLLDFWLEHYNLPFKDNDVKSLEESTGFQFTDWVKLVRELVSPDVTSPNSILHHISLPTHGYKLPATVAPSCTRTD